MKKLLSIILVFLFIAVAYAAELQPIPFPFIGRWQPSEEPTLLDDYGLQDIQNLRKVGKHFKGIGGHTVINSTSISSYPYFLNGFHFVKDQPQESHVIVLAANSSTPTASYLYQNTTAIPSAGLFSATPLHTNPVGGKESGRFSNAPAGNMVYTNGVETLIWGGSEIETVAFIVSDNSLSGTASVISNPKDYSDAVRNTYLTTSSMVASISSAYPYWFVGFYRPLQGTKYYISTLNNSASTMTVKEWNGTTWSALTITDNTSSAGKSLGQNGTVTWSPTTSSSKPRYINGLALYWYQFFLSAGSAKIYYTTVDAPLQSIKNIWDGSKSTVAKCWKYDGTYKDYTNNVTDDSLTTYVDVSSLSTAHYIMVGFAFPQQGLDIRMVTGSENSTASTTMTLSVWDGGSWQMAPSLFDGTATSTTSLNKSGTSSFLPIFYTNWYEFPKAISDEIPLYYYKLSFAAALDGDCKIGEIKGIPSPQLLATYTFSHEFQNRLFLFNEYNGEKNKAIYSVANVPDIFNGSDSGSLYFGDKTGIMAAAFVYNVFKAGTYDQLIVTKKNETYRLSGDGPTNWVVQRMSANVGCVAPLSMVSCEISDAAEVDVKRHVAIWQSDKGFVMTDGAAIIPISDDIKCYFDPNDLRYIPTTRQTKTVAWYDHSIQSYKALISSGAGQTTHNVELEYSLKHKEWTKIYRVDSSGADPLQSGFQVWDTNGIGYTYGGNTKGFLYRLENGSTFAGNAMSQVIHTKDLILDAQIPLFRKSAVKFLRTALKKKSSGGTVTIAHYGDQVLTVSGSTNQVVPSAFSIATAPYNTQSCQLGPFLYHSFKFTSSQSTADGMELTGLAIYAEPYTVLR